MKETTETSKLTKVRRNNEMTNKELKRANGGDVKPSKNRWFPFTIGMDPCDGKMPH